MRGLCSLIWFAIAGSFRSRAALQIEILVLRHQINVLRRRSPKRLPFGALDRLIFAGLCGLAPKVLDALAIVRPETVVRWHRAGFRLYCLSRYPESMNSTFTISIPGARQQQAFAVARRSLITDLSAELQNLCGAHLNFGTKLNAASSSAGKSASQMRPPRCLRLETIGRYDPDEDEFEANTQSLKA